MKGKERKNLFIFYLAAHFNSGPEFCLQTVQTYQSGSRKQKQWWRDRAGWITLLWPSHLFLKVPIIQMKQHIKPWTWFKVRTWVGPVVKVCGLALLHLQGPNLMGFCGWSRISFKIWGIISVRVTVTVNKNLQKCSSVSHTEVSKAMLRWSKDPEVF